MKGVALERIVCVTGISRGTVAGLGDGRGDDGAEAGGGVDSSAGWGVWRGMCVIGDADGRCAPLAASEGCVEAETASVRRRGRCSDRQG